MRTHGWGGRAPRSDAEAVARILDAAQEALDACGADMSLADVARRVDVTRQTVYRYFPSVDELILATANRASLPFVERMVLHLRGIHDPAAACVESFVYVIDQLPHDRYLRIALALGHALEPGGRGDVAPGARAGGRPPARARRRLGGPRLRRRDAARDHGPPAATAPVPARRPHGPRRPRRPPRLPRPLADTSHPRDLPSRRPDRERRTRTGRIGPCRITGWRARPQIENAAAVDAAGVGQGAVPRAGTMSTSTSTAASEGAQRPRRAMASASERAPRSARRATMDGAASRSEASSPSWVPGRSSRG